MALATGALEAAEPVAEKPLEFRRCFVPADRPQDWPKRNIPYLPVDREEFDRLLDAANSAPRGRMAPNAPHVTRAVYTAHLAEKDLLQGEARLDIARAGEGAALMNLEPFGLSLLGARWDDETLAAVGLHASGKLAALVDRSQTLILDWSLRGRRDASGSLVFAFDLPASAVCRLELDLPESLVPTLDEGVAADDGSLRQPGKWHFELGGRTRASLKVEAHDAHGRSRRLALLQEKTTYRFSPGGLDIAAQWKLDVHREPLRRLRLDVGPQLRIVSVQYGGAELGWSAPSGGQPGEPDVVIDFPEPLLGPGRVVTVTALAPLVMGPLWKLPRLRVRDVTWQEGDMTLLMPPPLALDALRPHGCRQTKFTPRNAATAGDSLELQLFSADAAVEIQLSPRRATGTLASGSTIRFAPDAVRAEFRGRFDFSASEVFLLQAGVGPGWQIESVTADRAGALANWSVRRAGRSAALVVHFAEPITESKPLELLIAGRRRLSPDLRFTSAMLTMLDFHDVVAEPRLMALVASDAQRVSLDGADRPRLQSRGELTAVERGLLASALSGVIIRLDFDRPDWNVAIEPRTPRYEGDLRVVADVSRRRLTESYRIRCQPDGSRVDHVLIAFSQAREESLQFTGDEAAGPVVAERLDPLRQAAHGLPLTGEAWLVRLSRAVERPFEIQASREIDFTSEVAPALVSLPEAVGQQGTIEIRRQREAPVIESADRLEPTPSNPPSAGEYAAVCGAFRYDPLDELGNASPAAVVLRPRGGSGQPAQAVVWRQRLLSHYLSSGNSRHRAVFEMENQGLAECVLKLPADAELTRAEVDGEVVAGVLSGDELRVTLPATRQFPVIMLEYAARGPSSGLAPRHEAPWPAVDLPIASREWIVSTASQFEPLVEADRRIAWPARVLGPMARASEERPFDATRLADWKMADWRMLGGFSQTGSPANPSGSPSGSLSHSPLSERQIRTETMWDEHGAGSVAAFGDFASKSYRINAGASGASSVRLVRSDAVIAAAWALAAVCAALGGWLARSRPVLAPLMVGLAVLAVTWIPPALLPLAWGALAGSIAALLRRWLRPAERGALTASRAAFAPETKSGVSSSIVGAALLVCFAADARGVEAAPEADKPLVHRVFVPVDAADKPATRYQVPTDFLEELHRRASLAGAEPRGWLITSAAYQCALARENEQIGVRTFSVRYGLTVLSPDARLRIPADRRRAELLPDSATLDGQPIDLAWDAAGQALTCELAEPGAYQLEFRMLPLVGDEAEMRGLKLPIPRIAASTNQVLLPAVLPAVEIPGIQGDLTVSEIGRRISAEVGPLETLVVRWPALAAAAPVVEVEELLWLKVRPGSVVLDVDLNYNVASGALRQVEFAADRRLRLLPTAAIPKERILPADADTPDAPQTTQLELPRPATGKFSLRLSFFLTGASGVGNIRLPAFHALHGHVSRRWLAVTVDPGLEYEARDAEQLEVLPAAEFAAKWTQADAAAPREADASPLRDALAYRLDETDTAWSLATRSREPQTTVKEALSLSFRRGAAEVRYDAQLMTTAGFVFQHRLLIPPDLDVERVTLEEEGLDRTARWARPAPGVVTVFLNRRITGPQQLTLWGRLPVRANGRLNLPVVTLDPGDAAATIERAEVLQRAVHLYRQSSVSVALEDAAGLSEISPPAAEQDDPRLGRLVLSRAAGEAYSGTVVVSPNAPRISDIVQFTRLRYLNQTWSAEIDYRFRAEDGVIDALRFDLPGNWAANVEWLSPPAASELSDQPGDSRKALIVRPLKPLTGDCLVKFRAALSYSPGDAIAAPDVAALGMPPAERYWLLPRQVGMDAVHWDVQRMAAASLPGDPSLLAGDEGAAAFQAVGDHPQAVLSSVKAAVGAARVRLADLRFDGESDDHGAGSWWGAAAFDLEPGGRSTCPLRLAPGCKLLEVSVGGSAVTPLPQAPGAWQVPLHSDRLPQRLEVVFSAAAAEPALPLPIVAIEGWPVEETLLTVHAPAHCQPLIEAKRVTQAACEAARIESAVSLIDLSDETVASTPNDSLAAWYLPWAHWLVSCGREAGVERSAGDDRPALPLDDWLRVARRLRVEPLLSRAAGEPPLALQTMEVWQQARGSRSAAHFRWTGSSGPTLVELRRSWRSDWLWRFNETAWIGFAVLIAIILPRFALLADAPRRWPHALGVCLGLAWWLCCQPSAAGWLLVIVSLFGALRSAIKPSWSDGNAG